MAEKKPLVIGDDADYEELQGTDSFQVNTLNFSGNVITDSAGTISLGSDNLSTGGDITGGNLNVSSWNAAYGWGDHAGLYDTVGTASTAISTHESAYAHSDIAGNKSELQGGTSGQIYISNGTGYGTWTDFDAVPTFGVGEVGQYLTVVPDGGGGYELDWLAWPVTFDSFVNYGVAWNDAGGALNSTSALTFDGTDLTVATGGDIIITDNTANEVLYSGSSGEIKSSPYIEFNGDYSVVFTDGCNFGYHYAYEQDSNYGALTGLFVPRRADLTNLCILDYQDEFAYIDKHATTSITPTPSSGSIEDTFRDNSDTVKYLAGSHGTSVVAEIVHDTYIPHMGNGYFNLGVTFRGAGLPTHIKIESWDNSGSVYATVYDSDVTISGQYAQWVSPRFNPGAGNLYRLKITFTIDDPLTSSFVLQRLTLYHATQDWDPWHLHIGGGNVYGDVEFPDSIGLVFGDGSDATIEWDGTDLAVNTGGGKLNVTGTVEADGYYSSDSTAGATADVATTYGAVTRTLHFKDGLYTGYTDS